MKRPTAILFGTASLASLLFGMEPASAPAPAWLSASRKSLCVTEGVIKEAATNRLSVDVPKMRAYLTRWTAQAVEARFTYLGPSAVEAPLGSGEVRRQFGLKLRAQDACNLVYAVWRFEPESTLVVSVKSNPQEHTSAECGNRGYRNIKPRRTSSLPLLHPGETRTLRAEMHAQDLDVFVDDTKVWQGEVGPEAISLHGPVGIRSDNVRLELELRAQEDDGVHPHVALGCKADAGAQD